MSDADWIFDVLCADSLRYPNDKFESSLLNVERDLIQIAQFVASGKLGGDTSDANVSKLDKVSEKLRKLKHQMTSNSTFDRPECSRKVSTRSLVNDCVVVRELIQRELVRSGASVQDETSSGRLCQSRLLSDLLTSPRLDGLDTILEALRRSGTVAGKSFISQYHLHRLSRAESVAAQLAYVRQSQAELTEADMKTALRLIYSGEASFDPESFQELFRSACDELNRDSSHELLTALYSAGLMGLSTPACDGSDQSCPSCSAGCTLPYLHKTRSVLTDHLAGEPVHLSPSGVVYASCPDVLGQSVQDRLSRLDSPSDESGLRRKIFIDL